VSAMATSLRGSPHLCGWHGWSGLLQSMPLTVSVFLGGHVTMSIRDGHARGGCPGHTQPGPRAQGHRPRADSGLTQGPVHRLFTKTPRNQPTTPAHPPGLETGQAKQRTNLLPVIPMPLLLMAPYASPINSLLLRSPAVPCGYVLAGPGLSSIHVQLGLTICYLQVPPHSEEVTQVIPVRKGLQSFLFLSVPSIALLCTPVCSL
jgi:hypothetical protein